MSTDKVRLSRRHWLAAAGGSCGIGGGLLAESVFVAPCLLGTTRLSVGKPTADQQPLRLIQLSDLHLRSFGELHTELLATINAAAADLILLTGDTLDCRRGIGPLEEFLRQLPSGPERLAVIGNWEYRAEIGPAAFQQLLSHHGFRLLLNESIVLEHRGQVLRVTGFDDLIGGQPTRPQRMFSPSVPVDHLVLAHCPATRDLLPSLLESEVSLMLSGHTHGGQIAPVGIPLFTPPGSGRYVNGWYVESGPAMYVSRGIGTSTIPIRLGATPELVIVDWWLREPPTV